jgi:hypothetical protein
MTREFYLENAPQLVYGFEIFFQNRRANIQDQQNPSSYHTIYNAEISVQILNPPIT